MKNKILNKQDCLNCTECTTTHDFNPYYFCKRQNRRISGINKCDKPHMPAVKQTKNYQNRKGK